MPLLADSLLWKIERADVPGPSYLFGTMHLRSQHPLPAVERARERLAECDLFLAEMDLDATPSVATKTPDLWQAHVSTRHRNRMLEQLRAITGLTDIQILFAPPLLLINHLATAVLLEDEPPLYLDRQLWDQAGTLQLERGGLETPDELQAILRRLPMAEQVRMLRGILRNTSRYRKQMRKMNDLYETEKIGRLYQSTRTGMGTIRKLLLLKRNVIMARRLATHITEKRVFAAVGAAHLAGGKGVLRLLKQRGFQLRPVF